MPTNQTCTTVTIPRGVNVSSAKDNSDGSFQICVYDKDGIEQEPCVDSVRAAVGGRPAKLSIEDGKLIAR